MKNAYQDGRVLDIQLTADVVSGGVIASGRLLAIAVTSGKAGNVVAGHVEGVFHLPKLKSAVFAAGDAAHWDVSGNQVISGGTDIGDIENFGYAIEPASSELETVLVRLCPGQGVPKTSGT